MKKSKAFTLIELIAVLVILAILSLIVTPLVLNIIRKARTSADKRSIDAYGRSIELAVASYLLDEGKFPTSIEQLTIEYSGDRVECETTKLNKDSSVYLANCTVAGRTVANYTYGKEETAPTYAAYSVGDKVSYNNVTYYVIEDSNETNDTVKLLKENPLLKTEMDALNLTDVTIDRDHRSNTDYGLVQYGSTIDYATSTVKKVVDAWANSAVKSGDTATARLIKYDELLDNLGYENNVVCTGGCYYDGSLENVPNWVYNSSYEYWTMSQNGDSSSVWSVQGNGNLNPSPVGSSDKVRPVLELNKSADITKIN